MFKGKRMEIFGAFKSKGNARAAELKHAGSFIREKRIRGQTRYVVMREKKHGG